MRFIIYKILIVIFIVLFPRLLWAQQTNITEIKASWIYTVTDWIYWKSRPDNQKITICTIGRDKVYIYLKKMERQSVAKNQKNNFTVKNKDPNDNFSECYILYISESEQDYYQDILKTVKNYQGVVTVSSIKDFTRFGGAIEFVIRKKAYPVINLQVLNDIAVNVDNEFRGWAKIVK